MKILLLNPPSAFEGKFVSREQGGIGVVEEHFLPSEIFLTAAYLREAGHDVDAIDLESGDPDFSAYQVVVVWVCVLHTFHKDISWLCRAKESGCRTVMILNDAYSGFEADTLQRYPFIDAAVRLWERQISLDALLTNWGRKQRPDHPGLIFRDDGGLTDTGEHARCGNMLHLVNCAPLLRQQPLGRYEAAGITPGRGCTARHRFCRYANTAQGKRPLEDVLAEIEAVADHVKWIFFLDPDLPSGGPWTDELCRELIKRKLPVRWRADVRPEHADPQLLRLFRESGCEEVMMGVQTLDLDVAKKLGAGYTPARLRRAIHAVRSAGIKPLLFFYIGWPWDGPQSLEKFEQFLLKEPVTSFYLKQVRPWPGTRIREDFKSLGLLKKELTTEDFVNSGSPLCPTLHLSIEELADWKKRIGRAGILQPGYLWRFFKERRLRPRHVAQFAALLLGRNIFKGK
jgi:hypothetical protein